MNDEVPTMLDCRTELQGLPLSEVDPDELERCAREHLPAAVFDRIAGGADDERSVRDNRRAYERYSLQPRILRGSGPVKLETDLLGSELPSPILVAPMGTQRMVHDSGELGTARAAAAAGVGYIASSSSSYTLEEIASVAPKARWFQLYGLHDRRATLDLLRRAQDAGFRAICLTVDVPTRAFRRRDHRNQLDENDPSLRRGSLEPYITSDAYDAVVRGPRGQFAQSMTWRDLESIRSACVVPLLLKGILSPEDAAEAANLGVEGLIVSNHGGRQLGRAPATLDALDDIVNGASTRVPVVLDGGIRSPADVVTALALGADAVTIGRPLLWSLAIAGEVGAESFLGGLVSGVRRIAVMLGCTHHVREVDRSYVRRRCLCYSEAAVTGSA